MHAKPGGPPPECSADIRRRRRRHRQDSAARRHTRRGPAAADGVPTGRPGPARAGRDRREDDPDRFARHHARHRASRPSPRRLLSPGGFGPPTHGRAICRDFAYSGRLETDRLGHPPACDHPARRRGLDRVARARSRPNRWRPTTPPLDVQVVSLDWKWLFIYPNQHVASVNQLVVPAGVPIHFSLTSASVMNAFFIPQLGSMIYTMNGMTTQLNLQADAPGTFRGLSSHFSGDGFPGHAFRRACGAGGPVRRLGRGRAQDRPERWTPAATPTLATQSIDVRPFTYRAADPGLFQQIATQALPPGPGPQPDQPNRDVSPRTEK